MDFIRAFIRPAIIAGLSRARSGRIGAPWVRTFGYQDRDRLPRLWLLLVNYAFKKFGL